MTSFNLALYSDFQLDPTSLLLKNFRRLAIQKDWKKKSQVYKVERRAFLTKAVQAGFLDKFRVNINSLQAWQSLCQTIGVPESKEGEDVPQLTSISACKQGGCLCYLLRFSNFSAPVHRPSRTSTRILSIL